MALIIEPGSPDADAYVDIDEVTEYFTRYSPDKATTWQGLQVEIQEAAIRSATKLLDYNVVWKGCPTHRDIQALQHPRVGLVDRMCEVFPDDEILPDLKTATAELAYQLATGGATGAPMMDDAFAPFKRMTIASNLSFELDDKSAPPAIPSYVMDLVAPWAIRAIGRNECQLIRA